MPPTDSPGPVVDETALVAEDSLDHHSPEFRQRPVRDVRAALGNVPRGPLDKRVGLASAPS
jgi:hypothetical protein